MKKLLGGITVLCLAFAMTMATTGCTKPKDKTTPVKTGDAPPADKDVKIKVDPAEIKVTAGEEKSTDVKVTVTRGKDAKNEVTLSADTDAAAKVTLTPGAKVAGDKTDGTLTVKTSKDTPKGTYTIKVKAVSDKSADATADIKLVVAEAGAVVVPEKKEYVVSVAEVKEIKVKAGEKHEAKAIKITLDEKLTNVDLKVGVKDKDGKDVDAKIVNVKVTPDNLKKTTDVVLLVEPAATAPEGEYTVWIAASGDNVKKSDAAKVKLTVEKAK
jgi:uncharacterized membrane protein